MRVFFICQRVPYPPDRGDKIATYHLLRHLARIHEVHVFCLADGVGDLANVAALDGIAASVTAVPVGPWRGRLRALLALVGTRPLSVAMLCEPGLHEAVRNGFARLRPDQMFVYSSTVAQFAEPFGDTERTMHFADLDSQKWRGLAARTRPPMKWIYALEARRLLIYERKIARQFSRSLVCTSQEAEDFRRLIPGAKVDVLRNGVDLEQFRPGVAARSRGALVFTGVMNYPPNVDAMVWFCTSILPRIRAAAPWATMTVCGSSPSRAVRRLARIDGVTVTGRVADVRPYLDRAAVFVAPMRLGRGIQNKLLEAMAAGLPVVTTTGAWQATEIPAGEGILAADSEAGFAEAVTGLLLDDDRRTAMGRMARAAMERGYGWEAVLGNGSALLAQPKDDAGAFEAATGLR